MSEPGSIGSRREAPAREMQKQKRAMIQTAAFFIIGLSVFLSYQWWTTPPTFRPDAPDIILSGILIATIIYFAAMVSSGQLGRKSRLRFCPACGRQIPFDAALCPYCGQRLP